MSRWCRHEWNRHIDEVLPDGSFCIHVQMESVSSCIIILRFYWIEGASCFAYNDVIWYTNQKQFKDYAVGVTSRAGLLSSF